MGNPDFLFTKIQHFQFPIRSSGYIVKHFYHEPLALEIAQALPMLLTLINKLLYFHFTTLSKTSL